MERTELFNRASQRSVPLWLVIVAVTLLAARIAAIQIERHKGDESLVHWVELDEARSRSIAENKPILYDFTAAWCGPCRGLEEEVFNDPKLAERINEKFIPVRVTDRLREDGANSAPVQELQQRYTVRGFPTVVVADAGGTQQGRMEGFGFGGRDAFLRFVMKEPLH